MTHGTSETIRLANLIRRKFRIGMRVTAAGRRSAHLENTPQKPLHRANEPDPIAIAGWQRRNARR